MNTFKQKLKTTAARFKKDTKGNMGMMFAVSVFAIIAGVACAVDGANAYFSKQRLQDTTDVIALMAARGGLETQADLTQAAQDYFDLHYPGQSGSRIVVNSITRNGDAVTVNASNNLDTYFTGIFGFSDMDVSAESTAVYSNRNLDIALVLDTTFSMSEGGKIASLKTAANNLVDTFDDFENDNLRVSVVPFAQYVNVGTSRRNANWLDVPADQVITYQKRDVVSRSNCRNVPRTGTNDGVPRTGTRRVCDVVYSDPYDAQWTATWRGCVGSRLAPWHERAEYASNKIPGILNSQGKCGTEILPLTDKLNKVKQTINALTADGNTYIPAGLSWGWRALHNEQPLTQSASMPVASTDKVLVLMTDGENFRSKNGILHTTNDSGADADMVTARLCENIKRDDIQVFTIAYDVTDTPTKNMLRSCATASANFFDASNASQLNAAFQAIGESLNELRITS